LAEMQDGAEDAPSFSFALHLTRDDNAIEQN
jgi:hypothetical protein